jgi:hypothetical protein
MADKYASQAGAGTNSGADAANAWTFAQAAANAVGGDVVHCLTSASYTTGIVTMPTGTIDAPIIFRAYNSAINDLQDNGLNADGSVNTTNFATLTCTGLITPGPYCFLENFIVTGALSSNLYGSTTVDHFGATQCTFTNTQNNASARCVQGDSACRFIRCEFYCSGAAHNAVATGGSASVFSQCRVRGTESSESLFVSVTSGIFDRCVMYGGVGIGINLSAVGQVIVTNCTFYDLDVGIQWSNSAHVATSFLRDNHVTDCTKWLESLTAADVAVFELGTRTRDNTTPRTMIDATMTTRGEVTTDTGGAATDYTNAAGGDFTLISAAPGRTAGFVDNLDIGAYQHAEAAGTGGGPLIGGRLIRS